MVKTDLLFTKLVSFSLGSQLTYIFTSPSCIWGWSQEMKQKYWVFFSPDKHRLPLCCSPFSTCWLGVVCQSNFGNDGPRKLNLGQPGSPPASLCPQMIINMDFWASCKAWNKNKLLCYATVSEFIYYNIHCYFNQYNSLDYYANSDLGTIAFGLYYLLFLNSFIW